MQIEIEIKGSYLVVRLVDGDDQGDWTESEASIPIARILAAAHTTTPAAALHRVMGQPFQDFKEQP